MIYGGSGFLRAVRFGSSPNHFSVRQDRPAIHSKTENDRQLADGRRGGEVGGRGAESYDRRKAWSPIKHSMISLL
jgi:hypothetical protein